MASRPSWKGALKLSLIAIPVRAYAATRPHADVAFRQFHRVCHTPIQLKKWCPHCEVEVGPDDIVKGHETSKGRYVFVEDEDIAKLRPASTETLDVTTVIDASAIDPRYVERAYYLAPDSKAAASPFAVIRKALDDKAAIGRFAVHGREYLAAVVAEDDGLAMYTLRTAGEVVARDAIPELSERQPAAKAEEVRLARRVIESLASDADLTMFKDNYETALREMLERKGRGETIAAEGGAKPRGRGEVVNLMDALRRSLDAARASQPPARRPRSTRSRRARVVAHPSSRKTRRAS
ncbi:MAG TPA: Ku protein [Vicinamibacterales bacterium]|jgi:DNA end-binding protein Ku|nr:Ku protein [Vicinamibacterales bacterium]